MTEDRDADLLLASQDYKKLERTHFKAGFRSGVEEGKDEVTPRGFRSGFRGGVETSVRWARLRGRVSAVEVCLQRHGHPVNEELTQLRREIEAAERVRRKEGVGNEDEDGEDVRGVCEVVEGASVPGDLVRMEEKVEAIMRTLE